MLLSSGLIAAGVVLLALGAHFLVRGASALALLLKVKPVVIGLTVVAVGTSLPELFVGAVAALDGRGDIVAGNVIGSNIINIALVLGLSAVIIPIAVPRQTLKIDWLLMIAATAAGAVALLNGTVGRFEGVLLASLAAGAAIFFIAYGRRKGAPESDAETEELAKIERSVRKRPLGVSVLFYSLELVGGLILLRYGSDLFVDGSVGLGAKLGVSERLIGVTIVAFGTSLPELAVSLIATFKGRSDVGVGNIVGSNLFNIAGILGICAFIRPVAVSPAFLTFDLPWMIGISILFGLLLLKATHLDRLRGTILLISYAAYTTLLFV